jgi:DNA-directed RNA polymerase specialized sigma24 family protein
VGRNIIVGRLTDDPVSTAGNGGAHEDLRSLMFSIAYRMLGTVSDAEDIVQEAFQRLRRSSVKARPWSHPAHS